MMVHTLMVPVETKYIPIAWIFDAPSWFLRAAVVPLLGEGGARPSVSKS